MPTRRSPNIEDSPYAHQWLQDNPIAAQNLFRIIALLLKHYAGRNHGYIDRKETLVEYRFDPIDHDRVLGLTYIEARKKHSRVRFYVNQRKLKGRWGNRWRILKNAVGSNIAAVDFEISPVTSLDELEAFLKTTRTFSGDDGQYSNANSAKLRKNPLDSADDVDQSAIEGNPKLVSHLRRERNEKVAKAKKDSVWKRHKKLCCEACGFDFHRVYGELGEKFCEVHHLKPLSEVKGEVETTLDDLAILCSNCHRIIHRKTPMLTIEKLQGVISRQRR